MRHAMNRSTSALLLRMFPVLLGLIATDASAAFDSTAADQVYVNARVWTGDDLMPSAEAFAVRGDKLVFVGSSKDARRYVRPGTSAVDLHGRRVVPGFIDAHWHFLPEMVVDLYDSNTLDELQRRLKLIAERPSASGWINNGGWAYAEFPDRIPHRRYVDAVVGDRPAFLMGRDGHMAVVSSRALALAHIDRDTPDPPSGRIERDANGEPTGELKGSAVGLVWHLIPPLTADEKYTYLRTTYDQAVAYGITFVHEMADSPAGPNLPIYERMLAENSFTVRMYGATGLDLAPERVAEARMLRAKYPGPVLKFGMIKGILDGTIDAKTAWMLEPFVGGGNGFPYRSPDEFSKAIDFYDHEGFQIALHAIGDHAIRFAIDALEAAARKNGPRDRRDRIEHIDVPTPRDLARLKGLGLIASSQPNFAYPDETNLTNYAVLLGPERMARAQALADFDRAGVTQVFGSDYPVSPMNVLQAIHTAVTRTTNDGRPAGGWYPEQKISVVAALRHFTRDAAYASFDEQRVGTLSVGKLADFVVLSEDILAESPESLLKATVLMTVMGGRVTCESDVIREPTVSSSSQPRDRERCTPRHDWKSSR